MSIKTDRTKPLILVIIAVPRDSQAKLQQRGFVGGGADLQPETRRAKIQRLQPLPGKDIGPSCHHCSDHCVADEEGHGGPEGRDGQPEGKGPPGRHEESDREGAGLLLLQHLQHALHPGHRSPG